MRKLKVHFSATSYPEDLTDWRGLFIRHMAFALARSGRLDLEMWTPPGDLPPSARARMTEGDRLWLSALMKRGGIAHLLRTDRLASIRCILELLYRLKRSLRSATDCDLYHLNWLQTALALPNNGKPALVTVLGTDMKLLDLPMVKALLRRKMRARKLALCPNAEWMTEPLSEAFGDLAHIEPVPFGIDPVWYAIERQPVASRPIWLVITRLTRGKLGPLLEWAKPLFHQQNRELHVFGPMQEQVDLPAWITHHGPVTPKELAAHWFPRAHGLITLSQHAEGRPQVMLEAMAAGIPIIASRIDAHENFLEDGLTGRLCSNSGELADAVGALENQEENRLYGRAARDWANSRVGTWDDCAQRYINVYEPLVR